MLLTPMAFMKVTAPINLLAFRGIYIDNGTDRQFVNSWPADTPDVNGDTLPDPNIVFRDNSGTYRPELAQVYDWVVKPPINARP
jgi:hypothetical protein